MEFALFSIYLISCLVQLLRLTCDIVFFSLHFQYGSLTISFFSTIIMVKIAIVLFYYHHLPTNPFLLSSKRAISVIKAVFNG